jgi:hypothetical protein
MLPNAACPVAVDARLDSRLADSGLSRWLWLVKWVLAIPHYAVLVLLWPAVWLLTLVAMVPILFIGRYPRTIFDVNLGVLRWSWRVGYYTYSALGAGRYPPFTLAEVPDYPAQLHIPYPQYLSRGLVLVTWWLLAIPHYLVLGVLLGGAIALARHGDIVIDSGAGLLVLVAAIALLVAARFSPGGRDFVLGINRWALRAAAYALLMTDTYPPFQLGTGPAPIGPAPIGPARDNAVSGRDHSHHAALSGAGAKAHSPAAAVMEGVPALQAPEVSPAATEQLRDPLPFWAMVALGLGATAMLSAVVWATSHLHPDNALRTAALFVHLAALVVGFGAVLVVDWVALLWLLGRRSLGNLTTLASAAHVPIWLGLVALVLSGALCRPDLSLPLTWVKLGLVLLVTLNGLHVYAIGERLTRLGDRPVPRHMLRWAGTAAVVSQVGWWGAMLIGFINAQ